MQVAPVNNSAASASGSAAVEETDSRARDFSRLLQNAFFSQGTKAVARSSEPTAPEAASRSDTRADTRGDSRPDTRVQIRSERPASERPASERPAADSNPATSRPSNSSTAESSASSTAPRNETAPAKDSKPADKPAAGGQNKPAAAQNDAAGQSAETVPVTDPVVPTEETVDAAPASETAETPVVLDADAALILGLLQMQAQPQPNAMPAVPLQAEIPVIPDASVIPAATDAVAEAQLRAQLLAAGQTAPAATPAVPGEAAPAVPAAPAAAAAADKPEAPPAMPLPQAAKPADAPVLPLPAALPAEMMIAAKSGTDTSAAALLAQQPQQPAMTPEQLAALQAAMQTDGELQTALQDQMPRQPQGESQPSTDPAPKQTAGKGLLLDIQPAAATTQKPAVDQTVLLATQGDAEAATEQMLVQQQLTAAQHHQSTAEAKFAAALHAQMNGDAQPQAVAAATAQTTSVTQQGVQPAPMSNPGTSMPQAVQHATTQTLARQLGAHIPAGEQVAVQIKKGAAEGADKISIKLDPGNLGKVEVKLEVGHDGKLLAVIAADKPETLAMLQRDAQQLEQSLRDVGLKTDSNSLSFSLREQGQNADGREGQGNAGRQRGRGHEEYAETGHVVDAAAQAASNAQRAAAARGGLDIRI